MCDMILAMQVSCMHWIESNHLEKEYLHYMCDIESHKMPYALIDFTIQYLEMHADKVIDSPDLQKYIDELDAF